MPHHKRWVALSTGLLAVLLACGSEPTADEITHLDTSDGVSRAEAEALSQRLFSRFVGCGRSGELKFAGTHWEVETALGFAGRPGPLLLIHAESGVISWGPSCRILNPAVLFEPGEPPINCERPAV